MISRTKAVLMLCIASMNAVSAHPGEDHSHVKREADMLSAYSSQDASILSRCANSETSRALKQRSLARRFATANNLRLERGIDTPLNRRDLASLQAFEAINHDQTGVISSSDPSVLFSANTSCVLSPEVTIGPYYIFQEMVRQNITDGQVGVPMHVEIQFVNINNCQPVPNLLIDVWSTNATGVYSGITGQGGLNSTFCRGVQQTSSEGVVEFSTIFPGHYSGRTTHTHLAVHTNATLLPNGTYTGGTFSHVGQLFYPESLIAAVEKTSPYSTNTVKRTTNDEDNIAQAQAENNFDPLVQYVLLNQGNVGDGLFVWIEVGIDPTANHTSAATWAAVWAAGGGYATNSRGAGSGPPGGGQGGPGGRGNGTMGGGNSTGTGSAVNATASSGANLGMINPFELLRLFR